MALKDILFIIVITLTLALIVALTPHSLAGDNYQYLARKLPAPKIVPDFTLTNQDGKPLSLKSLRGKLVLMTFGFTHCPNICPTTLANLANVYKLLLPDDQARVQVLFVSVDPERDTQEVLKEYVSFFDNHFIGLTGQPDEIATMKNAYSVQYRKDAIGAGRPNEYNIEHTTGVFLVDRSGQWIGSYRKNQLNDSQRVADDLRRFLALSPSDNAAWQTEKRGVVKTPPRSGRQLYIQQCASCHLENGRGIPGKYPSLVQSTWVIGAPNRITALLLDGVKGGHEGGERYAGVMPAYRTILVPADAAALLTYIRQSWGNTASPISADYVQKLFYQLPPRPEFWSWKELEALPPDKNADDAKL
jgi:protein SCO1/2